MPRAQVKANAGHEHEGRRETSSVRGACDREYAVGAAHLTYHPALCWEAVARCPGTLQQVREDDKQTEYRAHGFAGGLRCSSNMESCRPSPDTMAMQEMPAATHRVRPTRSKKVGREGSAQQLLLVVQGFQSKPHGLGITRKPFGMILDLRIFFLSLLQVPRKSGKSIRTRGGQVLSSAVLLLHIPLHLGSAETTPCSTCRGGLRRASSAWSNTYLDLKLSASLSSSSQPSAVNGVVGSTNMG